jgi:hypothetical protein
MGTRRKSGRELNQLSARNRSHIDSAFETKVGAPAAAGTGSRTILTPIECASACRRLNELTLTGSASWNSSNQTNSPYIRDVTGQPITSIPNPYGSLGSTLATGFVQNYDQRGYTTYDAFAGVSKDAWTDQLYCENFTDTRANLFTSSAQSIVTVTVNRPRTAGLRFSYKFGGQ